MSPPESRSRSRSKDSVKKDGSQGQNSSSSSKPGDDEAEEEVWDENYDEDEYDSYYDEEEESESESESEEESSYYEESEPSEVAETLSSGSVPTSISDEFDPSRPDRQNAQVVPEPPWAAFINPCVRLLFACFLPLLLAALICYGLAKCFTGCCQVLGDMLLLIRQLIKIGLAILFSPVYFIWKLAAPPYVQGMTYDFYKNKIGVHIKTATKFKTKIENILGDIPNIVLACSLAAWHACVKPIKTQSGGCIWYYIGNQLENWILTPLHEASINRAWQQRRKRAQEMSQHHAEKQEMMRKMAPKLARVKARMKREKAKRLLEKKKQQQLEITLSLAHSSKGRSSHHKVQLQEKTRHDMISRTFVIERRYAVYVGFIWVIGGLSFLTSSVVGVESDQCLICEVNGPLAMKVCRQASGTACAFKLHETEMLVALMVVALGVVLLSYATFLYKARRKTKSKKEIMRENRIAENISKMHKTKAEETEAVEFIIERRATAWTPGRIMNRLWRSTPCHGCAKACSTWCNLPLYCLLKWEKRHRLAERSRLCEYLIYLLVIGWVAKLYKLCKRRRDLSGTAGESGQRGPNACWPRFLWRVSRTRCGHRIARGIEKFGQTKVGLTLLQLVRQTPFLQKVVKSVSGGLIIITADSDTGSWGGSGRRGAAGANNGLEAVLQRFGFLAKEEEEAARLEAEKEKNNFAELNLASNAQAKQLEIGAIDGDIGVMEEEPGVCTLAEESDVCEETPDYGEGDLDAAAMSCWTEWEQMMEQEEEKESAAMDSSVNPSQVGSQTTSVADTV